MTASENRREQKLIIFVIALASFMGSLDGTIVNISLPTIAESFAASTSLVSWVLLAYMLVIAGFLPAFGKLGDRIGFRKVFIGGFVIFTAGSFLCGTAGSIGLLILYRAIQAVGAAMFAAIGPAMVSAYLPHSMMGRALGYIATVASLGLAIGPLLGGFLSEYLGWNWIFFINVPVGVLAVAMALKVIPEHQGETQKTPFDTAGAVLIFVALSTLLFGLNKGQELGWTSTAVLGSLAVAVFSSVAFYVHEKGFPDPLIDMKIVSDREFTLGNTAYILTLAAFNGLIFLLPFYLEIIKGIETDIAGIYMMAPAFVLMVAGPAGGIISDRFGESAGRAVCAGSALLGVGAFMMLAMMDEASSVPFILGGMVLAGAAIGLYGSPITSIIMSRSPKDQQGVVSSVMTTGRKMGGVLGVVFFEVVFVNGVYKNLPEGPIHETVNEILVPGFQNAFHFGALCCLLALILTIGMSVAHKRA